MNMWDTTNALARFIAVKRQLTPVLLTGLLAKSEDLEGEGDWPVTGSLLQRVSYQIELVMHQ